jgi:hypothetical protein
MKIQKEETQTIVEDYGRTVPQRIPLALLERIENYERKNRVRNRTEAINQLLEIALIVIEHKELLKDEHLKEEIIDQLREGGLVDYFRTLSTKDLTILNSIVRNEVDSRK